MATLVSPGVSIYGHDGPEEAITCEYAHQIDIDLDTLDQPVKTFIKHVLYQCGVNDVQVVLANKKSVKSINTKYNGFFDELTLQVATKRPLEQWLYTFVHESCHFDQWRENCRIWRHRVRGCNPMFLVSLWLEGVIELKAPVLYQAVQATLLLELDCEKRSIKKIRKNKLPLDIKECTKRANAYVYFYHMFPHTRSWYHIGAEPYNIPEIVAEMPDHFNNDYTKLPTVYKKLYAKHCFNGVER